MANLTKPSTDQKFRNLIMNRTQDDLERAGIYFSSVPMSSTKVSSSPVQTNLFSNNYLSNEDSTSLYYTKPYQNEYIPYDYQNIEPFHLSHNQTRQDSPFRLTNRNSIRRS